MDSSSYFHHQDEEEHEYEFYDRYLAPSDTTEEPLDYTVLSVGVLTLGLILFVEVIRHRLDHEAHGRPFFKTVLEGVYSELATLGIVELFIFLLLKYYEDIDYARKEVFGDVHFALFYTAIFNAFQSVLVAIVTTTKSTKLWVQTEHLELDHYVEIREEFDRVQKQIGLVSESSRVNWLKNSLRRLRYRGLRGRFLDLLVQVRFHELRLYFIEGNSLPLTLKVSDYLKRSEQRVLMSLVHISGVAWLLLTGCLNLMYFLMGIVAYKTGDAHIIGTSLTWIFFSMLISFIFICLALYVKMRAIFREILSMKYVKDLTTTEQEAGVQEQKNLFWLGEPKFVIYMIQFMQFGYALALAIVLMFWDALTGEAEPYFYLLAVVVCYAIFVYVLSKVLPQFTLCTSLGHLVDQKHLQETVAIHRLEEAQRCQRRKVVEFTFDTDSVICLDMDPDTELSLLDNESKAATDFNGKLLFTSDRSESSAIIRPTGTFDGSTNVKDSHTLLADLVKSDTASLRQQLPEKSREVLLDREQRMRQRKENRKKSVSDGVAVMRSLGQGFSPAAHHILEKPTVPKTKDFLSHSMDDADALSRDRAQRVAQRKAMRKKSVSASGIIQSWRNAPKGEAQASEKGPLFAAGSVGDTKKSRQQQERVTSMAHRRDNRRKSLSASAVIESWHEPMEAILEPAEPPLFFRKDKPLQSLDDTEALRQQQREARMAQRSHNRHKSVSASAVIESWQDYSVQDPPTIEEHAALDSVQDQSISDPARSEILHHIKEESSSRVRANTSSFFDGPPSPVVVNLSEATLVDKATLAETQVVNLSEATLVETESTKPASIAAVEDIENTEDIDKDKDDDTDDTGKSVGDLSEVDIARSDFKSDFENAPKNNHEEENWNDKLLKHLSPSVLEKDLRQYFLSDRYHTTSHVFGTLTVFFLIGHRVESMNAMTNIYDASDNTWELNLNASFWWEATWYMLFIVAGIMVLSLFPPAQSKSFAARRLVISAVLDLLLSVGCLALLFVAEAQRCCDEEYDDADAGRFLAGEPYADEGSSYGYDSAYGTEEDFESAPQPCCPFWGSRTHGGLGNIEPFTSLIAFRIARFAVARFLVDRLCSKECLKKDEDSGSSSTAKDQGSDENAHGHHGAHTMQGETGTPLELWERAIGKYPDIVEKYGQFSAELFQAMLGLDIIEDQPPQALVSMMSPTANTDNLKYGELKDAEQKQLSRIQLTGDQYCDLPAEAQGIIIAGRLGKPVKSVANSMKHSGSMNSLPTLAEESHGEGDHFPETKAKPMQFEIDDAQLVREQEDGSSFIAPNARVLRSMRRCDRRLLPLLKEWIAVDVVMTQFEILYLEAHEEDTNDPKPETETSRLALQATKGGKGLRLCDVAAGRKVVGHLDLADVTEVHVERDTPLSDLTHLEDLEFLRDKADELPSEYWLQDGRPEQEKPSRQLRWAKIMEDRLKLVSTHGSLILRFYSDLDDIESHLASSEIENEVQGPLKKDIAFQWAQTVVHTCGREQLKQNLPHFGDRNSDELRDYLEVVHYHEKEFEETRKKGHHRKKSMGDAASKSHRWLLPGGTNAAKPKLRVSKSFGEDTSASVPKPKRILRRIVSSGETPDSHDESAMKASMATDLEVCQETHAQSGEVEMERI